MHTTLSRQELLGETQIAMTMWRFPTFMSLTRQDYIEGSERRRSNEQVQDANTLDTLETSALERLMENTKGLGQNNTKIQRSSSDPPIN